jgi:CTP synthase
MIKAITWARTEKVPFLGICLGMQLAVIEYARNVAGIEDAGSEELHPAAKDYVIIYMPEECCLTSDSTFANRISD